MKNKNVIDILGTVTLIGGVVLTLLSSFVEDKKLDQRIDERLDEREKERLNSTNEEA